MIPKFRVWDKKRSEMINLIAINFHKYIAMDDLICSCNDGPITRNFQDVVLMQPTGLYDSTKFEDLSEEEQEEWLETGKTADEWQGREVFEGDILTSQDGTDGLISRFIVKRDEFYTGFTPMNREGCGFNRTMCEVIGNVLQHPELLEV